MSDDDRLRAIHRAICDPAKVTEREHYDMDWDGMPKTESLSHWQARAVIEVTGLSAADLVTWLSEQAAEMEALSKEPPSPGEPIWGGYVPAYPWARGPGEVLEVLEGERAVQRQLARSLTAAIAHIAAMRPALTRAMPGEDGA